MKFLILILAIFSISACSSFQGRANNSVKEASSACARGYIQGYMSRSVSDDGEETVQVICK